MDKILIIDGNSLANRAFYALPFLSNRDGQPTGAVFGFANILIKIISELKPDKIAVAFDHARKTFRNEIYSDYKAQRKETPKELLSQFPLIKQMLKAMNICTIEVEGIEADDIIGTLSRKLDGEKYLLSGDRDLLQLINENTVVWLTKKGVSVVEKVDKNRLKELFNLSPEQIVDLKALMGDSSDNIPGVSGVGEKTALGLLEQFDNLENVYQNLDKIKGKLKEKLEQDSEKAFMSKKLATIKCDCEFEYSSDKLSFTLPFSSECYNLFKKWDFSSLLKPELFGENQTLTQEKKMERVVLDDVTLEKMSKISEGEFIYNLQKLEFIYEGKLYFLEQNYQMFDSGLSFEDIALKLKNVFENEKVLKITPSAKEDMHALDRFGIKLSDYSDAMIANYVVNVGGNMPKSIETEELFSSLKAYLDKMDAGLRFVFNQIELPLCKILFEMEKEGFKINDEKLEELDQYFSLKLQQLRDEIYNEAGEEFNINSTQQTANVLFDNLGIKSYNNKKRSTAKNVLEELSYIPVVAHILEHRKLAKIKNTYIDVYKQICHNNGDIIHTTFNQTLTNTGRLSSSEPNLQNIPTRDNEGKELRKLFVSKYPNGKIISADYNQIELRLLADMSGEEKLIAAYNQGLDIHTITASEIFHVPLEQVTAMQRQDAKAVNFGIIYGISDYGLSQNIKSTRASAKLYIDSYFEKYPKVKQFMDSNVEFARQHGYALTKFGRRRIIGDINSSKYLVRNFAERVAMNMPLQGTASDIIKIAMIKVSKSLQEQNLKSKLILQIHDELIVDCYPGEENAVEEILKTEMENITDLKVPLKVSIGIGENLYECK